MEIDLYDISEPKDVLSPYNDNWMDKLLNLEKWSEKKQMLDDLIKTINVPKIKDSGFYPIVNTCKKRLINDSNINL